MSGWKILLVVVIGIVVLVGLLWVLDCVFDVYAWPLLDDMRRWIQAIALAVIAYSLWRIAHQRREK